MSHKNKKKPPDLPHQAHQKIFRMLARGEGTSKHADKITGQTDGKIYSRTTAQTYYKHLKYFCRYVRERHPECRTLDDARQYTDEWLCSRIAEGLSSWTIQLEAKAIGKLYGIKPDDPDYFHCPARHRQEITRSRLDAVRDKHFSEERNSELINFARGTGLRRSELEDLRGRDLVSRDELQARVDEILRSEGHSSEETSALKRYSDSLRLFPDKEYFVYVEHGKGGWDRYAPICADEERIVDRLRSTEPDTKVWKRVNSNADIHGYRAEYCNSLYLEKARATDRLSRKELYCCRGERSGEHFDRAALAACSCALGHSRLDVVVTSYLRN